MLMGRRPPLERRKRRVQYSRKRRLPAQDGVGRDDDQRLKPAGPKPGQAGPEQAVGREEPWAGLRSLVDDELLTQVQVLESELAVAADNEGKESE
jgi:hypothetical protein